MKIPHRIKNVEENKNWKEWIAEFIGEENKDYFWITARVYQFDEHGTVIYSGHKHYWNIPDESKAKLFQSRFS